MNWSQASHSSCCVTLIVCLALAVLIFIAAVAANRHRPLSLRGTGARTKSVQLTWLASRRCLSGSRSAGSLGCHGHIISPRGRRLACGQCTTVSTQWKRRSASICRTVVPGVRLKNEVRPDAVVEPRWWPGEAATLKPEEEGQVSDSRKQHSRLQWHMHARKRPGRREQALPTDL